jgi:hypothetical protein
MASYREMDAVGRDPARFILLAKQCLVFRLEPGQRKFCKSLIAEPPERLSTRQAEWLFEIRDEYELHSTLYDGSSVAVLIEQCYEARLDFDEGEDDEAWIIKLWKAGTTKLSNAGCGRLRRCAVRLRVIEMDDAA